VDIDKTLIIWEDADKWHAHKPHIKLLQQFHLQGHGIVLWSAGGYTWIIKAIALIKEREGIDLEPMIDIAMNKPDWHLDDKRAEEFMLEANRIFLEDVS
jgi:hypothetical protein